MKRTFLLSVRVVTAKQEFAEGMGVGVIASQEITFDIPENHSEGMMQASLHRYGEQLIREEIALDIKEIT